MPRRAHHHHDHDPRAPQYEWALNAIGQPVHISHAERGGAYYCPLCRGRMIARLGDVVQHHFAHESLQVCTPEGVARAAAGRWIALELEERLKARRPLPLTYPCPLCDQPHTVDLLAGVTLVGQGVTWAGLRAEVALLDATGRVRVAIVFEPPEPEPLVAATRDGTLVLALTVGRGHRARLELAALLAAAAIYGGRCDTQRIAAEQGIVTDIPTLRALLVAAVAEPPGYAHGPLIERGGLTHVLALGDRLLWLPPILWQRAIGGLHHTINPALQVITQEWPQDDGATIALYYVTVRDSCAVAVRRFPPGQGVYARLSAAVFHTGRLTAAGVARSFAET